MKIWWCEVHGSEAMHWVGGEGRHCNYGFNRDGLSLKPECQMVEAELTILTKPTPYDIEIPDFVNRHGNW